MRRSARWKVVACLRKCHAKVLRMRCFIVRHAEKEPGDFFNPQLRHQDQPISSQGRVASQKLAAYFAGLPISAIYVSAYQRTRQTIEPLAQQLHLPPIVDQRLNEIDNGRIEGLTEPEIQQAYPAVWNALIARTADFRFPEGETGAEAQDRIVTFLQEKRALHDNETILLVSHDGLIRLLMCYIVHAPVYERWNLQVDTCGIMEITLDRSGDRWRVIRFNQTCEVRPQDWAAQK